MSNNKEFETVYEAHKRIESSVVSYLKNAYSEDTWDSFSLERQVEEVIKHICEMDEIKYTSLEELEKKNKEFHK